MMINETVRISEGRHAEEMALVIGYLSPGCFELRLNDGSTISMSDSNFKKCSKDGILPIQGVKQVRIATFSADGTLLNESVWDAWTFVEELGFIDPAPRFLASDERKAGVERDFNGSRPVLTLYHRGSMIQRWPCNSRSEVAGHPELEKWFNKEHVAATLVAIG